MIVSHLCHEGGLRVESQMNSSLYPNNP